MLRNIRSFACCVLPATLLAGQFTFASFVAAQSAPEPLTKDETYFAIARRSQEQSESPVSAVVAVLDEVIEVGQITPGADGKTTVVVKEKAPSSAAYTQKSIRLVFAPAAGKWKWESFEDRNKQYPVEKLFPYAKDEIGKRKQAADAAWARVLEAMTKQADAAMKVLETAKAVIKSDPLPLVPVTSARQTLAAAMAKARESGDQEAVRNAYKELVQAVEPVATLGDQHSELKTNDAWLRLQEEFLAVQKSLPGVRKSYVEAVAAYNEILHRLPFGLVAYGMGFTKMEPQVEAE
ncbi:MAG TPA: LemA family protein [Blastocatellia bacterium]|nr:LemA family protein [Blastocatellia bacterium]